MGNSVTGPGARLDAENDNLHAYCDRLEAENATLRERVAELEEANAHLALPNGGEMRLAAERDALAQRLAELEREVVSRREANELQTILNSDLRRQLKEARAWIQRFRDADWDDTLRWMQFQAGDYK